MLDLFPIIASLQKQTSLDESVQMDTPPRSPPEPPGDEELLEIVHSPPPEQLKQRSMMTSKQRWHIAFNKIVMQLNVSNTKFIHMYKLILLINNFLIK